jgi:hypothetical protein
MKINKKNKNNNRIILNLAKNNWKLSDQSIEIIKSKIDINIWNQLDINLKKEFLESNFKEELKKVIVNTNTVISIIS